MKVVKCSCGWALLILPNPKKMGQAIARHCNRAHWKDKYREQIESDLIVDVFESLIENKFTELEYFLKKKLPDIEGENTDGN